MTTSLLPPPCPRALSLLILLTLPAWGCSTKADGEEARAGASAAANAKPDMRADLSTKVHKLLKVWQETGDYKAKAAIVKLGPGAIPILAKQFAIDLKAVALAYGPHGKKLDLLTKKKIGDRAGRTSYVLSDFGRPGDAAKQQVIEDSGLPKSMTYVYD